MPGISLKGVVSLSIFISKLLRECGIIDEDADIGICVPENPRGLFFEPMSAYEKERAWRNLKRE